MISKIIPPKDVHKRRKAFPAIAAAVSVVILTGCGGTVNVIRGGSEGADRMESSFEAEYFISSDMETGSTLPITQKPEEEILSPGDSPQLESAEPETSVQSDLFIIPELPLTGRRLSDFVPEGWQLLDSVELDYNEDGFSDYVAVLQAGQETEQESGGYPRILFALASSGAGQYRLDFQNENLIPTRDKGGPFGDPYLPMTVEGNAFITHSYGGSSWRGAKDDTYEYIEGTWYLTRSEELYEFQGYVYEERVNDWKSGIGIRKKSSSEFDDMEANWDVEGESKYDLVYEMSLDEMPTLWQAGMRCRPATDLGSDGEVRSLDIAEGVELAEDGIRYPYESFMFDYLDEDCVLYSFQNEESGKYYLAIYCWQDKSLSILMEADSRIEDVLLYKDNIYYVSKIVEDIRYRTISYGRESVEEKTDVVGVRLNRVDLDGAGQEIIFEYRYPGTEQDILDDRPPYLSVNYEVSGDEIVLEVYIGEEVHPFYRMKPDGTECEQIGSIPKG